MELDEEEEIDVEHLDLSVPEGAWRTLACI